MIFIFLIGAAVLGIIAFLKAVLLGVWTVVEAVIEALVDLARGPDDQLG